MTGENAKRKWNKCDNIQSDSILVSRSITAHYRYIQFRTLHNSFFTYDILCKIEINATYVCKVCKDETDINEHVLLRLNKSVLLLYIAHTWINSLGMEDNILIDNKKIFGETIALLTSLSYMAKYAYIPLS